MTCALSLTQTPPMRRAGLATKDALPVLIRVLAAVESQDPISTDAISSILRMLVPQPDELGCRVRAYHQNFIQVLGGAWSGRRHRSTV